MAVILASTSLSELMEILFEGGHTSSGRLPQNFGDCFVPRNLKFFAMTVRSY
jgi:hypothetical protein